MSDYLEALHSHQKEHHKIATDVLRWFALQAEVSYPTVRDLFIEGHPEVTQAFWLRLNDFYPNRFIGVDWCHGCRKFNLKEVSH